MGMVMSVDIFQAKVNKLLGNIEGLKAYIDNTLVLNKGNFADCVEQLRIFLTHPQGWFENQYQEI